MRQVFNVVAINFKDLLLLKQILRKFLNDLNSLSDEVHGGSVRFYWQEEKLGIWIECSPGFFPHKQTSIVPKGVSSADWACLISEELGLLLSIGNRFVYKESITDETVSKGYFDAEIQRA